MKRHPRRRQPPVKGGRPKKTIYLDADIVEALEDTADEYSASVSWVARVFLGDAYPDLKVTDRFDEAPKRLRVVRRRA